MTSDPTHIQDNRNFLSVAAKTGIGAILIALLLAFIDLRLSILPLIGFILLCLSAPFLVRFGFFLPIISRGNSNQPAVALTFDDGPDPNTTLELLDLLTKYHAVATFFVTGKKALQYPELVKDIVRRGHTVGNHTFTHDNLLILKRSHILLKEIRATQEVLTSLGIESFVFRPPVGMTNPKLGRVLDELKLYLVNYSCQAYDLGNRRISDLARKILRKVKPDDIILLHDHSPAGDQRVQDWLDETEKLIAGLEQKGLAVISLAELIGKPVMASKKTLN